ncbi:MAG: TerB family tellurite resistance protein [Sandaracinaceae bacterium]|nr:TerB family tellurite resistance protein [Sandaracinaceae bacterium]
MHPHNDGIIGCRFSPSPKTEEGMQEYQEAMLKALVAVAWADGRVEKGESEVIEALIDAFELSKEDADSIRQYAQEPRGLEDIPLTELSASDRRLLLQHAVTITYADGKQSPEEEALLWKLAELLRIPREESERIFADAKSRIERLLPLLNG